MTELDATFGILSIHYKHLTPEFQASARCHSMLMYAPPNANAICLPLLSCANTPTPENAAEQS
jgi:hypothetical protein